MPTDAAAGRMRVMVVAGARPNFMKIAPIVAASNRTTKTIALYRVDVATGTRAVELLRSWIAADPRG